MPFIPNKTDYFYFSRRPIKGTKLISNGFGCETLVEVYHEDKSFTDAIFQCCARDDTMVIASTETGVIKKFRIKESIFEPVGPDVIAYMKKIWPPVNQTT